MARRGSTILMPVAWVKGRWNGLAVLSVVAIYDNHDYRDTRKSRWLYRGISSFIVLSRYNDIWQFIGYKWQSWNFNTFQRQKGVTSAKLWHYIIIKGVWYIVHCSQNSSKLIDIKICSSPTGTTLQLDMGAAAVDQLSQLLSLPASRHLLQLIASFQSPLSVSRRIATIFES
jgi:hypothetical protein